MQSSAFAFKGTHRLFCIR